MRLSSARPGRPSCQLRWTQRCNGQTQCFPRSVQSACKIQATWLDHASSALWWHWGCLSASVSGRAHTTGGSQRRCSHQKCRSSPEPGSRLGQQHRGNAFAGKALTIRRFQTQPAKVYQTISPPSQKKSSKYLLFFVLKYIETTLWRTRSFCVGDKLVLNSNLVGVGVGDF